MNHILLFCYDPQQNATYRSAALWMRVTGVTSEDERRTGLIPPALSLSQRGVTTATFDGFFLRQRKQEVCGVHTDDCEI
uniref:Uncharacterized protein n=1 Tax=Knipowitschia caucasica TaxID=637954 RepID=A0AAV2L7P2_KNICA